MTRSASSGGRCPSAGAGELEFVRRAVSGTLNREVEVEISGQIAGRWAVTLVAFGRRAPAVYVKDWEMDAMRQVPLVPAHLRGHFLRNYTALSGQGGPT